MENFSIRKPMILILFIFILLLSACTTGNDAKVKAWIDAPKEGININMNSPVMVMSHVYAVDGASEVILYADGEAYRRDTIPTNSDDLTSITQEWIPTTPGEVLLQVVVLDKSGEKSLPASVLVNVLGEQIISPTPLVTLPEHVATTLVPTTLVPTTPVPTTLVPIITISPSITVTFTPTPTRTNTIRPPDTQAPPAPVQTSPGNPESLSCRTSQTLVWQAVNDESGIEAYYVKLEVLTSEGTWQSAGGYGPTTNTQVNANVQCDNMYRWMVRAQDGAGNTSDWSAAHMFIIIADELY